MNNKQAVNHVGTLQLHSETGSVGFVAYISAWDDTRSLPYSATISMTNPTETLVGSVDGPNVQAVLIAVTEIVEAMARAAIEYGTIPVGMRNPSKIPDADTDVADRCVVRVYIRQTILAIMDVLTSAVQRETVATDD